MFEPLRDLLVANGHAFQTVAADALTLAAVGAELALPSGVLAFYADSGPADQSSIPWVVESLEIFSVAELVQAQAGYRWHGITGEPLAEWSTDWVVVASNSGDPFFLDTTRDPCPVLFARHGAGTWSPVEIASSMESFVAAVVSVEEVLLGEFGREVFDDDGMLPAFVQEVDRRVASVLTADQTAKFVELLD